MNNVVNLMMPAYKDRRKKQLFMLYKETHHNMSTNRKRPAPITGDEHTPLKEEVNAALARWREQLVEREANNKERRRMAQFLLTIDTMSDSVCRAPPEGRLPGDMKCLERLQSTDWTMDRLLELSATRPNRPATFHQVTYEALLPSASDAVLLGAAGVRFNVSSHMQLSAATLVDKTIPWGLQELSSMINNSTSTPSTAAQRRATKKRAIELFDAIHKHLRDAAIDLEIAEDLGIE